MMFNTNGTRNKDFQYQGTIFAPQLGPVNEHMNIDASTTATIRDIYLGTWSMRVTVALSSRSAMKKLTPSCTIAIVRSVTSVCMPSWVEFIITTP